jgi:xeroderma pigmentosum group C-complementing protein
MNTTISTEESEYVLPENIYDPSTMDADVDSDMEVPVVLPLASNSAPITMREMAESAAKQREVATLAGDIEILNDSAKLPTQTSERKWTNRAESSAAAPSMQQNGARTRASRRVSTRKRERAIETAEDTDEEREDSLSPSKKRTRVAASSSTPAPPTRTLRPRASKTPAQIQEEKEQEAAFRRATTG